MTTTASGTVKLPSNNELWLVRLSSVSPKIRTNTQRYWSAEHYLWDTKYVLTAVEDKDINYTFDKIMNFKGISESAVKRYYMFFGHEIKGKTIKELLKDIDSEIKQRDKEIKDSIKAKKMLRIIHTKINKELGNKSDFEIRCDTIKYRKDGKREQ